MATIALFIQDPTQRLTLKTLLESEGHKVVPDPDEAEARFVDVLSWRDLDLAVCPTVLIASTSEIPVAVEAMNAGAYGYVFLPFQPHEAHLVVTRALNSQSVIQPSLSNLRTMESVEIEHIQLALRVCNGNQAKAARELKIGRNTLWRKLKKADPDTSND